MDRTAKAPQTPKNQFLVGSPSARQAREQATGDRQPATGNGQRSRGSRRIDDCLLPVAGLLLPVLRVLDEKFESRLILNIRTAMLIACRWSSPRCVLPSTSWSPAGPRHGPPAAPIAAPSPST